MKLTNCGLIIAAILCSQLKAAENHVKDNMVQCQNKSWHTYDVSFQVGTTVYADEPAVRVYSGETKALSIPLTTLQSLVQLYPDTFEVKAVVSSWLALGTKNKSLVFGSNPCTGGAQYINRINQEKCGLMLTIDDATSTKIRYSVFALQNK